MGWSPDEDFHPEFKNKFEELPGFYILQRDIEKALKGSSFLCYNNEDGGKIPVTGISHTEFNYYYNLWDDFHWLKILPHGKGSLDERRWVLQVIKIFEKAHYEVKSFIEEKNLEKLNNPGINNG